MAPWTGRCTGMFIVNLCPVAFVNAILWTSYVLFMRDVLGPWIAQGHVMSGLLLMLIYHGIVAMVLWSYLKVCFTHPGATPKEWSDAIAAVDEEERRRRREADRLARDNHDSDQYHRKLAWLRQEISEAVEDSHRDDLQLQLQELERQGPPPPAMPTPVDDMPAEYEGTPTIGRSDRDDDNDRAEEMLLIADPRNRLGVAGARPVQMSTKQNGDRRYCKKCDLFKPDRSHHCSLCGACVLRMDHHCPWIGNCVGFYNYKFFWLFLLWAFILSVFCGVIAFAYLTSAGLPVRSLGVKLTQIRVLQTQNSRSTSFGPSMIMIMAFVFGTATTTLGGMHFKFILYNETTIESMERHTPVRGRRRGGNPYDAGNARVNWEYIMGKDPRYWFIPTMKSVPGDGLSFPMYDEHHREMMPLQ